MTSERGKVVAEAKSWQGTPYHLNAQIKGVGVDCGTFLIACFRDAGLISDVDLGMFKQDFNLHRGDEIYRKWLLQYCKPVTDRAPLPGDIILYHYGRIDSHGAIVTEWPTVIHAYSGVGVIESNGEDNTLKHRQAGVFSFWE